MKQSIASVLEMAKHALKNVYARNAEIKMQEGCLKVFNKGVSAEKVDVLRNIVSVSKMEKNVEIIVSA